MNVKLIIFDLDNTLYDERQHVSSGFHSISIYIEESFEINANTILNFLENDFNQHGRGKNFNKLTEYFNLDPKIIPMLVKIYREHTPNIKCYKEVYDLLNYLKKYYKLAIITDGDSNVQKAKIKKLNISQFFDKIIYTGDSGFESKPNPQPYQNLLSYFSLEASQAIYIGDDIRKDFIGAKKLGIHTIQILKGEYKNIQMDRIYKANYKINNLTEIINILQ